MVVYLRNLNLQSFYRKFSKVVVCQLCNGYELSLAQYTSLYKSVSTYESEFLPFFLSVRFNGLVMILCLWLHTSLTHSITWKMSQNLSNASVMLNKGTCCHFLTVKPFIFLLFFVLEPHLSELIGFHTKLSAVDNAPQNWSMAEAKAELKFLEEGFKQVERNHLNYKSTNQDDPYKVRNYFIAH